MKKEVQNIKDAIKKDDIELALIQLSELFTENKFAKEIIGQTGRYNHLLKADRLGIITFAEVTIEKNKIRKSILEIIEELEKKNVEVKRSELLLSHIRNNLKLILAILSIIFAYVAYTQVNTTNTKKRIEKIDYEIASRIEGIDMVSWYSSALQNEEIIDLPKRFLSPPEKERVIYPKETPN